MRALPLEPVLVLIRSLLQETAQMLRSLEALGRSPGAQLEPGWPRFLGGNVLRIVVNSEGCLVWQGKCVSRKLLCLLETNLMLLKLS